MWRTVGYTKRRTELVAHSVTVNTEIFNTAFHKMNMDHERRMELVGERGELRDVPNSQCGDGVHTDRQTDRDWAETAEQMKLTSECNTVPFVCII
jgi:hypothetical protein